MTPMRILHVFKKGYVDPRHHYLGSVKDIRSRTEYFQKRNHAHEELLVSAKDRYYDELRKLPCAFWEGFDAILLEMTYSPGALSLIRSMAPRAVLLVRSHNAELLHRYHWARAQGLHRSSLRFLVQAFKNGILDFLSGLRCDYILSISQWEAKNYWPCLLPQGKAIWVPFFLPESYTRQMSAQVQKQNLCVHFGASIDNPLIADATANFVRAVEMLGGDLADWQFCATGATRVGGPGGANRIAWMGLLDDPYDVLCRSRAMALLSSYGFGFKTKILEAVMAKAFVILPRDLYGRLPEVLLKYCIPVDLPSEQSFADALQQCRRPFPEGDPNGELRREAFEQMDAVLMIPRRVG